jgi:hypothetical protein
MEASGQLHAPAALPPGEEPTVTDWLGGWVGPRACLDACPKQLLDCLPIGIIIIIIIISVAEK